jgi:predicted glycoside hydrolase/deacetylase ChbG (UPF0249 family)
MKNLIVNADDFGYSFGINKGIFKAHTEGIVTSTSLMVNRVASSEAKELINFPDLSVGLHFDAKENFEKEFVSQLKKFEELTGFKPTHLDSHLDVHLKIDLVKEIFAKYSKKTKIPVRGVSLPLIDSFFEEQNIKMDVLLEIIKNLPEGTSELMCHPGIVDESLKSSYTKEREKELAILTSSEVLKAVKDLGINLTNWSKVYR